MTIEKGRPWGDRSIVPNDMTVVQSDHALALTPPHVPVVLAGGDLYTAIGKPVLAQPGQERTKISIDALKCSIRTDHDVINMTAASSIVIGYWLPRTPVVKRFICITNAGIYRETNMAPRAHPNDGVFDVVSMNAKMSWRERLISHRRARTGTHVPHPEITVERLTHYEQEATHTTEPLFIDAVKITAWKSISVSIEPDYWQVFV